MKKVFSVLLLAMFATALPAAYQYQTGTATAGSGSLNFSTGSNIGFTMSKSPDGFNWGSFGMAVTDSNGVRTEYTEAAVEGGDFVFRNYDGTFVAVNPGDSVSFWVEAGGERLDTIASGGFRVGEDGYFEVGFSKDGAFNPGDFLGSSDFVFQISAVNGGGGPTGQPLPGALAVLAIGAVTAGACKFRRRKQTAAR
ncbi:MAG: hypothetical protein HPZ91_15900 [Lentisphaeria bacterium]|nr:hypothetical protein [Lentisphaeria bacterium]